MICYAQISVVLYLLCGFQYSRGITNEVIIIKGSSRIGYEGFVRPQKGQGEAKLN
jgi:hypothetical protein